VLRGQVKRQLVTQVCGALGITGSYTKIILLVAAFL
jgi:hypothetical protein